MTLGYGKLENLIGVSPYYKAVPMPFHEWFHVLCVDDKYDINRNRNGDWKACRLPNPAINSMAVGYYSQIVAITAPLPRPSSPYDKVVMHRHGHYRRVQIVDITSSGTYVFEDHATTGKIYRISISPGQYFLITNHQKLSRVEDLFRGRGLLIWHINESYPMRYESEKRKQEDLESAFGLWDYRGKAYGEDPEGGYDNLDFGIDTVYVPACFSYYVRKTAGDASYGYASPYDFFNEENKTVFDHLSNPSSDAYNDLQAYYVTFPGDSCFEDSGVWLPEACVAYTIIRPDSEDPSRLDTIKVGHLWWGEEQELNVPQNIATHIAIRNIRREGGVGPNMVADVYINYVQSDDSMATGPSTSPKLTYDGYRMHMVYTSKGYVYYTNALPITSRWIPAYPVDRGTSPTIAFSPSGDVCAVWIRGRELRFNCSDGSYASWRDDTTLYVAPRGGGLKPPAIAIGSDDTVHVVFGVRGKLPLGYSIIYGRFHKDHPSSATWRTIGVCSNVLPSTLELPSYAPNSGPSITLTNGNRPFVVWSCKDTVRYTYWDGSAWTTVETVGQGRAPSVSSNGGDTVILSYLTAREVKARYYALSSAAWSPETTLDDSAFAPTAAYPFVGWTRVKGDDWCDVCREVKVSYLNGGSWITPVHLKENRGYMDYPALLPVPTLSGTDLHLVVSRYDGRAYEVAHFDTLFSGVYLPFALSTDEAKEGVRIEVVGDRLVIYGTDAVSVRAYDVAGRMLVPTVKKDGGTIRVSLKGLPKGIYMYLVRWKGGRRVIKVVRR